MKLKIVYMGTPEFAADILKILAAEHDGVAVVTQQDKPQGENMHEGSKSNHHRRRRRPHGGKPSGGNKPE